MQDPPHLCTFNGVQTLSDCLLRDWEHLIEGTSSNRKQEALLWEKKKREKCLLHAPDNWAIIKITVRASWPFWGLEWRVIMCTMEAVFVRPCVSSEWMFCAIFRSNWHVHSFCALQRTYYTHCHFIQLCTINEIISYCYKSDILCCCYSEKCFLDSSTHSLGSGIFFRDVQGT